MNRLLRIISVFGAVLALSACVAPGYSPRYYGGGYHGGCYNCGYGYSVGRAVATTAT